MDKTRLIQFQCPKKLIDQVDDKIKEDGKFSHRTDLILFLLRKYVDGEIK